MKSAFFPQHRRGAALDSLRDVAAAILRFAGIGDEGIAARHAPAVGDEPPDVQVIKRRRVHTSSRTSGASGGGSTTLFNGASGFTPSSRSEPAITLLNTGAATVPP